MKTAIVIFGASGDLSARKLLPALFAHFRKRRLPDETSIIGVSRSPYTDDTFRNRMKDAVREYSPDEYDDHDWNMFARSLFYTTGDVDNPAAYADLAKKIAASAGAST